VLDLQYIRSLVASNGQGGVFGLHEISGAVAARLSAHTESEILEACRAACEELVEREHVVLCMTPAFGERPTRDTYVELGGVDALAAIRRAESWQPPVESMPRYWVSTTDAGESEYYSGEQISI
jgi:hypothetical protein